MTKITPAAYDAINPQDLLPPKPSSENLTVQDAALIPPSQTTTIFSHRFRYFILFLGCLCLTSICSNMIALNFTFICMRRPVNGTSGIYSNTTINDISTTSPAMEYYYNQAQKSSLMWASAIGSMVATFPFNYLYTKFGAKYVFFAAGIISTVATVFVPVAAEAGIAWFLVLRFFQGISYGADFAAIGILCSRWASLKQNGVFISILTCFTHIASTITNPVSGILCESRFGWPSVYYSHAAVSLIVFILWLIFYADDPATHKSVSAIELEKIHRNKTETHKNMESYVPYKEICKNPVILAVWFNAFVDIVSAMFLTTYIPTYINSVLHYGIGNTGWLAALPTLAHLPVKFLSGHLSDKIKYNERKKMIIFNSAALVIPGIIFLVIGHIPDAYPLLPILLFTSINAFIGTNCGGFYKCGTLVSRQFSAFVIANIQFIKCINLFLAPALVAIFVKDDANKSQWRTIFYILGIFSFIANIIFCYMATDKPADFTLLTKSNHKLKKNQHNLS